MEGYGSVTSREDLAHENRILDIQFSFDNTQIVKQLMVRGEALKKGNFKKAKEVEKVITHLAKNKFERLTRPIIAYVTFETQKGFLRAKRLDENNLFYT